MTHKERAEVREAMKAYKAEGHTMAEVADKFGYTKGYVQMICKGIAPQQSQPEVYRNQYTNGTFDREANAIRYINERTPNFEYAGNFTGLDGYVDLRCKTCGTVAHKSFVSVKHGKATCAECAKRKREADKKHKQIQRERKKYAEQLERERRIAQRDFGTNAKAFLNATRFVFRSLFFLIANITLLKKRPCPFVTSKFLNTSATRSGGLLNTPHPNAPSTIISTLFATATSKTFFILAVNTCSSLSMDTGFLFSRFRYGAAQVGTSV